MLKQIFFSIFLIVFCLQGRSEAQSHSTGFYIILEDSKDCANLFKLPGKRSYCLSKKPFIGEVDFEKVSEVVRDTLSFSKHMFLQISTEAFSRLHVLTAKLPKVSLALIIDGTFAGVFENAGAIRNPIPIFSNFNSEEIEIIHEKLKIIINHD